MARGRARGCFEGFLRVYWALMCAAQCALRRFETALALIFEHNICQLTPGRRALRSSAGGAVRLAGPLVPGSGAGSCRAGESSPGRRQVLIRVQRAEIGAVATFLTWLDRTEFWTLPLRTGSPTCKPTTCFPNPVRLCSPRTAYSSPCAIIECRNSQSQLSE